MTHQPQDTAGAELNKYWRAQQPKAQKPIAKPDPAPLAADTPPVIDQGTPKNQNIQGPVECRDCQTKAACRAVMKMWHQKAPRTEIVRAWVRLIDQNTGQMICLSGLPEMSP